MANNRISPAKTEDPEREGKRISAWFWCFFVLFIVLMLIPIFFFTKNRIYKGEDWILDNAAVGNYGDLVGGVIGSMVALYSAYLLVTTLRDQKLVNRDAIDTNKEMLSGNRIAIRQTYLQIFESRFSSLLSMYHEAITSYKHNDLKGHIALDEIMHGFSNRTYSNNSHYTSKNSTAMKKFEDFYAQNSRYFSVHMRTLYLLVKTIGEQESFDEDENKIFDEDDRVNYAKCIRAQLSEGEMVLIRYNCLTSRGANLRTFINQFNLIKHMPILSLLEFQKYRKVLAVDEISAINTMYIALKKNILEHVTSSGYCSPFEVSQKYTVDVHFDETRKEMKVIVKCDNGRRRPGTLGYPLIERALNKFPRDQRDNLFFDFLKEYLVFSNFKIYNNLEDTTFIPPVPHDNGNVEITEFVIQKSSPLIFAAWQMENPS